MLKVPVFAMNGQKKGEVEIDPALLGGAVRPRLLKQAIVTYLDHQRQRSARTKSRAEVEGSNRKLYRQKGTGNARAGMIRTPVRRGGGRTFAKRVPPRVKELPKKMRRLARDNAILAKIEASDVLIIDGLSFKAPKTKDFAGMLSALKIEKGCVVATEQYDPLVYRSGRNIPKTEIRPVDDLNAYDVMRRRKLIFTSGAFERLKKNRTASVA